MKLNKKHPLYQEDLKRIISTPGVSTLKGKSVLVTGATGLIGLQLIDALMLMGDVRVIAVGRSREKAAARLGEYYDRPLFTFMEQDVCLPFPDGLNVDFIIPLASNTHPLPYSKFPVTLKRTFATTIPIFVLRFRRTSGRAICRSVWYSVTVPVSQKR